MKDLHKVVAFTSNGLVLSDSKVSKHGVVTNVGSITVTLNVHSPLTSQVNNTI